MSDQGRKSRFTQSAEPSPAPPSDLPTRLISIMHSRAASLTQRCKRFEPMPPLRRKQSSVGGTPVTPAPVAVAQRTAPVAETFRPRQKTSISSGPGLFRHRPETLVDRNLEDQKKQEKLLDENTWISSSDSQYRPTILPFFLENKEEQRSIGPAAALIDDKGKAVENKLMFVQLPSALPWIKTKQKRIDEKGDDAAALMIQKFFTPSLGEVRGKIGKLKVFKSGKIVLYIGDQEFIGLSGIRPDFYQEFASVSEQKTYQFLGAVSEQLVFVPRIG